MEVITYEIQQKVRVRKYPVDCNGLCELLRKHKAIVGLSNKEIAENLCVPITKVEHWFRQDDCFAIPDEEIWIVLKRLLHIETDEFDMQVLTFEEKDNVFEKGNRIYDTMGICPTITCLDGLVVLDRSDEMEVMKLFDIPKEVINDNERQRRVYSVEGISPTVLSRSDNAKIMEVKVIGQMDNTIDHTFESANRVYDVGGISPTINTCGGGGLQPKIIDDTYANRQPRVYEDYSPALRSEREGLKTIETISTKGKQIEVASTILAGYERTNMTGFNADNAVCENVYDFYNNNLKTDGVCGTLTSACSHNGSGTFGVIENACFCIGGLQEHQTPRTDGISPSLTAAMGMGGGQTPIINDYQYRIRKLTPKECWRLMDFTDEDFEKAAQVNSNTQLYKQAGNSIVKNVLVAILGQMIPGKEDVYKKLETR